MIKGPKSKGPVSLTDQSNRGRSLSGCDGKQYRGLPAEIVQSLIRRENSTGKRNVIKVMEVMPRQCGVTWGI